MATKKVESKLNANGIEISVITTVGTEDDYISLTDIASVLLPERFGVCLAPSAPVIGILQSSCSGSRFPFSRKSSVCMDFCLIISVFPGMSTVRH